MSLNLYILVNVPWYQLFAILIAVSFRFSGRHILSKYEDILKIAGLLRKIGLSRNYNSVFVSKKMMEDAKRGGGLIQIGPIKLQKGLVKLKVGMFTICYQ